MFLDSLVSGEKVRARNASAFVSDRRMVEAAPFGGRWVEVSVAFVEVTGWRWGDEHDLRPFVIIDHTPLPRWHRAPHRKFLWVRWGGGTKTVDRTSTEFRFTRLRDPVFKELVVRLRALRVTEESSLHRRPIGTREERIGGSGGYLTRVD